MASLPFYRVWTLKLCYFIINCAGIYADEISAMAGDRFFTLHPRRGCIIIFDKNRLGVTRSAKEISDKEDKSVTREEFEYYFNKDAVNRMTKISEVFHPIQQNVDAYEDTFNNVYKKMYTSGKGIFETLSQYE